MQQRTKEWKAERLGIVTGTRAASMMGGAAARKTLLAEMISEVAMAKEKAIFQSQSMARGVAQEEPAISYYQFMTDQVVTGCDDYIINETYPRMAVSPDGLVGSVGGVEVKALEPHNHISVMIDGSIDKKYEHQIYWAMVVTGREWWDYFGFCDDLPEPLKGYRKTYTAEAAIIDKYLNTGCAFIEEFEGLLERFELSL